MEQYITPDNMQVLFTVVILPLLGVITKFAVDFIKLKNAELKAKANNTVLEKYLNVAEDSICTAVEAVSQTFVESMKKSGTFDKEAQSKAFEMAKITAIQIMGDTTKKVLSETYGDLEQWVDTKIESHVKKVKIPSTPPPAEEP